ncbi:hypothetical protein KKF91_08135, partial [Myxococcota bacterium]|nr:hypothetical protein [Myxococcota bacterium]
LLDAPPQGAAFLWADADLVALGAALGFAQLGALGARLGALEIRGVYEAGALRYRFSLARTAEAKASPR